MKRLRRVLWMVAGLLITVVIFQAFVGGVYPVASSSMAPTLLPGDQVLVLYGSGIPERGQIVVVHGTEPNPLVKRAVGLPGEEVAITPDGDLLIDRGFLPTTPGERPKVLLVDSSMTGFESQFSWASKAPNQGPNHSLGNRDGTAIKSIVLDGRKNESVDEAPFLELLHGIHDGYIDGTGAVRFGNEAVGDACVSIHLLRSGEQGKVVLQLTDKGNLIEANIRWVAGQWTHAQVQRVARRAGQPEVHEQDESQLALVPRAICVTLQNLDNRVSLVIDGERVAGFEYTGAPPEALDPAPSRFRAGVVGARLTIDRVQVWRDLHYTARGRFGVDRPVRLEPDELFLLGDNSAHSTDSREYGPVKQEHLIGRAAWIVWPPSRFGRVGGALGPQGGDCAP